MIERILVSRWSRVAIVIAAVGFLLLQIASYRADNIDLDISIQSTQSQILRLSRALDSAEEDRTFTLSEDLPWKSIGDASAEQRLQTWALNTLQTGGQTIRQYAPVPQIPSVDAPTVALRLEFSGSLSSLIRFVADVETHRPALAISNLQIRPLPQREQVDGVTMVGVQMVVWGVSADVDG